ncbi:MULTISPECIES: type III pantothenate kinase [Gammaproteobacteria]|uniref:type III pantothenate kinase n=1 Tax=Gammaproteobacteria TaxID=1236 RepID=UPI001ADB5F0F|nr:MULTISPECIES: type III pantothenate kinase [Gammaproteobacteria]MBO9483031.1 type III pantothenate kinase [Salinisphaera sp. G21_0]MBO9494257.1 type III pantothenate kinase [Thalassotalea sp. G20_0]
MRILELDAGNSRLKWRLLNSGHIISHGFLANSEDWQHELPKLLDQIGPVDSARAAIVSGDERFAQLSTAVNQHFNVSLLKAEVKEQYRGVKAAYPGLGVDRWLAMLAAHHLDRAENKEPCNKMVVSCGTAITIDLLSDGGNHLGGYIVPGVGLMKGMLHTRTAQLPMVEAEASTTMHGTSTAGCINNGILAMAVAMINTQQAQYKTACGKECLVYLTGGDATLVQPYIRGECYHHPALVMDGLALAFEQEGSNSVI